MAATAGSDVEYAVIGGGIMGAAIGYGLARRGLSVAVLDGIDRDFRAARANFGIVWVQGKGMAMAAYQRLTRRSADLWPAFADEIEDNTGIDLRYERRGGLHICLGAAEFDKRAADLAAMHALPEAAARDTEMLDRRTVERMLPAAVLGPDVAGASYCRSDGHVDPLRLLRALHAAIPHVGGHLLAGSKVERIEPSADGFLLHRHAAAPVRTARLVIAAGNGSARLGADVGLDVPLRPQRGQILVTERLAPFLPLPTVPIRQTGDGTVVIGSTQEEVGFDSSTTVSGGAAMAARAARIFPRLGEATLVRQWAGLRVMTPDSHPLYARSKAFPSAYVALCHSGVTLAAAHCLDLAAAIADGSLDPRFTPFHHGRFDVPQAA
jgi:glycine/D-amino acid oxidase-like deaminating enzyme